MRDRWVDASRSRPAGSSERTPPFGGLARPGGCYLMCVTFRCRGAGYPRNIISSVIHSNPTVHPQQHNICGLVTRRQRYIVYAVDRSPDMAEWGLQIRGLGIVDDGGWRG